MLRISLLTAALTVSTGVLLSTAADRNTIRVPVLLESFTSEVPVVRRLIGFWKFWIRSNPLPEPTLSCSASTLTTGTASDGETHFLRGNTPPVRRTIQKSIILVAFTRRSLSWTDASGLWAVTRARPPL